ncbi:hypothetical protein CERSUDRAFT_84008 [Gelatoporia subvermispora B]|uniref:Protein Asterix n=1 Tax=Ceriporiopsis subvermispora (strain B) TaxID=914234 RepID=M2RDW1_CERS8|nr:hypothetical protein CERSUDRAFT_84008 [Gelatoporia subvermispora B]
MSASTHSKDDPRDPAGEAKFTLPETWQVDSPDALSASIMFISGMVMVSRNRYLAWPALLASINSVINQHPLRTKDGGNSPTSTLMLAVCALISSYIPLFMMQRSLDM